MDVIFIHYWPFAVAMFGIGVCAGWWYQSPGSVDHVTAWLQRDSERS